MLQAANTDLIKPLVPKAPNSECQNLSILLKIKPVKVCYSYLAGFFSPSRASALKG